MLPAQVSNVCQAALPQPPPTAIFFAELKTAMAPREGPSADDGLFGDLFSSNTSLLPEKKHNEVSAFGAAKDFQKVCDCKQVILEKLDDWLAAFAKFVISPRFLFDKEEDQNRCMAERLALCEQAGVQSRQWAPSTLKTMANALSAIFKRTESLSL